MDPGIDALRCAVQGVPESDVIVLPNSGIALRVAELLASLTDKNVRVIPTRSVAQGLAAASAFRPDRKLDDVVTAMRRAIDRVQTVEISGANKVRSSGSGIPGQYVASVDGRLQVASDNLLETTLSAITAAVNDTIELITIFTGVDVDEATSAELVERLSRDMADIEIEIVVGGQPRYQFIIAME
jgi:dihydroxyacetone kinase-like predicted kinase